MELLTNGLTLLKVKNYLLLKLSCRSRVPCTTTFYFVIILLCVNFIILTHGANKILLEIKESLWIKRNKPESKNISSGSLFLLGTVWYDWLVIHIQSHLLFHLRRYFSLIHIYNFSENSCSYNGLKMSEVYLTQFKYHRNEIDSP